MASIKDERAEVQARADSLPEGLRQWRQARDIACARSGRKVLIDAIAETDRGPQYIRVEIPPHARYPSGTPIVDQGNDAEVGSDSLGAAFHVGLADFEAATTPAAEEVWWIDPQPYWGHRDADGGVTTGAWVLNVRTDTAAQRGKSFNLYELRMDSGTGTEFTSVATFDAGTPGDAQSWGSINEAGELRTQDDILKHLRPILDPELLRARGAVTVLEGGS